MAALRQQWSRATVLVTASQPRPINATVLVHVFEAEVVRKSRDYESKLLATLALR
jgi:hypothetical protein